VAVTDLNGDGKPDLVVANCAASSLGCGGSDGGGDGFVGILINTGLTPTATTLTSSPNPSSFGQTVTFTATATAQLGFHQGTPTGTVTFYDGTTDIGVSTLDGGGVASLTTSTLAVGTQSITATYNGDVNFAPSTSAVLGQVVQGAIAVLSPTSLSFPNENVGTASGAQVSTLMNTGNAALAVSSIGVVESGTADFAESNTCGASVAAGASCQITVTFKPAASGTRSAAISVADNAPGSPQTASLNGIGEDFSLAPSGSASATITPGQTATYTIVVTPGGGFDQTVDLSCTGAPADSTCSVASSVTLDGVNPSMATVSVTTDGAMGLARPFGQKQKGTFAAWSGSIGFVGLCLLLKRRRREAKRPWRVLGLMSLCVFSMGISLSGCGGGGTTNGSGSGGVQPGTYTLVVTGTSGAAKLTNKTSLTLIVQ
jgi:hypothetical protein